MNNGESPKGGMQSQSKNNEWQRLSYRNKNVSEATPRSVRYEQEPNNPNGKLSDAYSQRPNFTSKRQNSYQTEPEQSNDILNTSPNRQQIIEKRCRHRIIRGIATAAIVVALTIGGTTVANKVSANNPNSEKLTSIEQLTEQNPNKFIALGHAKVKINNQNINVRSSDHVTDASTGETNRIGTIDGNTEFDADLVRVNNRDDANGLVYCLSDSQLPPEHFHPNNQYESGSIAYIFSGADNNNLSVEQLDS